MSGPTYDPLRRAEKLRQRIVANSCKGLQVVFLDTHGRPDCCTLDDGRHQSFSAQPGFFDRVVGVFDARVSAELLAASLREVAA